LELRKFIKENHLNLNQCGKVVVTTSSSEVERLEELFRRGVVNGVDIELHEEHLLHRFEPTAKTVNKFIWSPTTSVVDPKELIVKLLDHFIALGGKIEFDSKVNIVNRGNEVYVTKNNRIVNTEKIINAAGAFSDLIGREVGVGTLYSGLPFKGNYRKSTLHAVSKSLIYPVPHPINPFLGVHTTITHDGYLKIGPTALLSLGRENYSGWAGLSYPEMIEILRTARYLGKGSAHDILEILSFELPLLLKRNLLKSAAKLSLEVNVNGEWEKLESGIRSQLVNLSNGELVQDFVVERHLNSLHFLNIVSPGWTSALPFTRHFTNEFLNS
jgi:L-2-hydroxyglutarate oxidase LhgO